jgi:hypothetical protein
MEGREIDLDKDAIESFKMSLKGPVIFPGEDGYDQSRSVWNAMIDRRPAFVVRCLGRDCVCTVWPPSLALSRKPVSPGLHLAVGLAI